MPQSIFKAQKSALESGFFDTLGKTNRGGSEGLNAVEAVLFDFLSEFITLAKDTLETQNHISTGELSQSIKGNLRFAGGVYTASVSLADYYDFVNQGVRGLGPENKNTTSDYSFRTRKVSKGMKDAIRKWLIREGLKTSIKYERPFARRRVLEDVDRTDRLAYAVAASIKKKGFVASNFFTNAYNKTTPKLADALREALKQEVKLTFRNVKYGN